MRTIHQPLVMCWVVALACLTKPAQASVPPTHPESSPIQLERSNQQPVRSLEFTGEFTEQVLEPLIAHAPQQKLEVTAAEIIKSSATVFKIQPTIYLDQSSLIVQDDQSLNTSLIGSPTHPAPIGVESQVSQTVDLTPNSNQRPDVPPDQPTSLSSVDLNPSPDLLQRPKEPSEVEIRQEVPISLQQAIELAERNSQELQTAALRLEQSQAQLREARSALFPTFSLQGNLNRALAASGQLAVDAQRRQLRQQISSGEDQIAALQELLKQPIDSTDPNSVFQRGLLSYQLQQGQSSLLQAQTTLDDAENYATLQFTGGIGIDYTIFSGEREPLIQAARQNVRSNELELRRVREQLRLDVTTNYYQLQQADQQIQIEEAAVREATRSVNDSEKLTSAGLATRLDILNSEVQLGDATQRLVRAQSQQRATRRQLARTLNLAVNVDPLAGDPIEKAGNWNLSLEESIVMALNNRAELEQSLANREIGLARQRAALGSLFPRLSFSANYNMLRADTDDPSDFAVVGTATGYSLGLSLQWNFFDGGLAAAQARQRQLDAAIAEVSFSDRRGLIRLQVEQAYFDLEANEQNLETAFSSLERAREALRLSRLRFQAGAGIQSDILDAETRLTQAQGNLLQAVLGYNLALATLQRAVEVPRESVEEPADTIDSTDSVNPTGSTSDMPPSP